MKIQFDSEIQVSKLKVEKWEKKFISENNLTAPTNSDYNKIPDIKSSIKKIKFGNTIRNEFLT